MNINLELIKTFDPCSDGLANYIKYYKNFNGSIEEFLKLEHIPYDDKTWLVRKVVDTKTLQYWAVNCARFVLSNYEDRYPGDNRVRNCIEVTEKYLLEEANEEELRVARSAYSADYAAARSARSAARSARSAANSAAYYAASSASSAYSAAHSADSAAYSANSAAYSAADSARSAARLEQQDINLSLLIGLL